jgi:phage regulator Rha-like protein
LIDLSGLGFERTDETLFKSHYAMLNLTQLAHYQDSLNTRYDKREKEFIRVLSTSNYFKRLNFSKADSNWYKTDSIMNFNTNMG